MEGKKEREHIEKELFTSPLLDSDSGAQRFLFRDLGTMKNCVGKQPDAQMC